jgi:hypothetical protein
LLNARHSAIRETLRGIARTHGQPVHQPVGLTTHRNSGDKTT